MRRFDIDCHLEYEVDGPTHFLFQIEAARIPGQEVVREQIVFEPSLPFRHYLHEESGNRHLRIDVPAGRLSVRYLAQVMLMPDARPQSAPETKIADLPDEVLHLLTPTRYCESDALTPAALKLFADTAPGVPRVEAITDWIANHVDYRIGSSDVSTTARDIFVQRAGVCRDFAHLGIAFCRAMNIPARFVVGYVKFEEPPPDFHAVFEAYVGGRWHLFDATGLAPVDRLVRVGTGRDAKDVAFATLYGPARMLSMSPEIEERT